MYIVVIAQRVSLSFAKRVNRIKIKAVFLCTFIACLLHVHCNKLFKRFFLFCFFVFNFPEEQRSKRKNLMPHKTKRCSRPNISYILKNKNIVQWIDLD